jgi:hypothetical protein
MRAASPKVAISEVFILVVFLALAFFGMISCFAQLRHLVQSEAEGRLAATAKRKWVVCERTSASTARRQAFRLY